MCLYPNDKSVNVVEGDDNSREKSTYGKCRAYSENVKLEERSENYLVQHCDIIWSITCGIW
jgi:hypothetical protein